MEGHRAGGDPRAEEVVLDLLVDDDVAERPEARRRGGAGRVGRRGGEEGDQDRHRSADVGADDRDELRHDPLEDREGGRERHVRDAEGDVHPGPVDEGEQEPRVEVAARLTDRLLPHEEHTLLPIGAHAREQRPPELRTLRHEVEREQGDRRPAEEPADQRARDPEHRSGHVGRRADDLLGVLLELLDQLLGGQLDPEGTEPLREPVDERRRGSDELVEPRDHGGDDQGDQQHDHGEQDHEDQPGRRPPLPAPRGEVVDGGLQRERQEQGDPDHREEAAELAGEPREGQQQEPGRDEGVDERPAGGLDRVRDPRRHPFRDGIGLDGLDRLCLPHPSEATPDGRRSAQVRR